jgi:hypothetical protein
MVRLTGFPQHFSPYSYAAIFRQESLGKETHMTNAEMQKNIDVLAQQQLALATAVNRLSTSSFNSETPLEVDPQPESRGDLTSALEDFTTRSRNYKVYARTRGHWIFRILTPQSALESMIAATAEGLPAVAGIAESVVQQSIRAGTELTGVDRQFVGSVVRYRMEANGYRKAEKKGFIPCAPFTKGQLYQQIG